MLVTIHGHFYQPPRENPWTGEIPRQESAAPFHDWNERITDECYGPCGRSRVLDSQGKITAIVNNFTGLSFDFGPTLLHDLARRFPYVYRRILEADRESVERHGGHGNAIAQAFNHMILPLATYRDKLTQVRWGLRDFEARFGRRSEGLWLPETACDAETLEVVAGEGVKFLILAPRQARRIRRMGQQAWTQISAENPLDTSRPYRCLVDGGDRSKLRPVDVFFYDGALSVAISFEHLLRGSGNLAGRLQEAGRSLGPDGLVHVATDGEVYGHHEPFADMCLAHLFRHEGPARGLRFVNYPELLALRPPEYEVELDFTETGEGTAWSCAHGVGRWIRDCGCSTGGQEGWNQAWRAPLRRGLDAVRDQIQGAFLTLTSPHLQDPWAARDDYINVLLQNDEETRAAFLARHLRAPADASTRQTIWSLLEATRQAMLMYTSCAWFFADISGLEVQQNLAYAARACELAQPFVSLPLEDLLLRHLEQARSNVPEWENGAKVYRELVLPRRLGPEHAAAQAAFESANLGASLDRKIYRYEIRGVPDPTATGSSPHRGRLRISDPELEQSWSWTFTVQGSSLELQEARLEPAIDPQASVAPFGATFRLRELWRETREAIAQSSLRQGLDVEIEQIRKIYLNARGPMGLLLHLGLPVPELHRMMGAYVVAERYRELAAAVTSEPRPLPEAWWKQVAEAASENRLLGLKAETGPLTAALEQRITSLLDRALAQPQGPGAWSPLELAYDTLAQADRLELPLTRSGLEPRAYDLVFRYKDELRALPGEERISPAGPAIGGPEALRRLAGHANLQLEAILGAARLNAAEWSPSDRR